MCIVGPRATLWQLADFEAGAPCCERSKIGVEWGRTKCQLRPKWRIRYLALETSYSSQASNAASIFSKLPNRICATTPPPERLNSEGNRLG
jgi:hypothetical protein